jgi:hypothetical protein
MGRQRPWPSPVPPSLAKLVGCSDSDIAARRKPLENDNGFERAISIATVDLELVRLNRIFIFACRPNLTRLDQLDVRIRVIKS